MCPPQGEAIAVTSGGSLSLARLALPYAVFGMAVAGLSGAGSRLVLEAVTVPENPEWGAQTGTVTAGTAGELPVLDPPDLQLPQPTFVVLSGPCTASESGRRVATTISVAGAGGALGACPVFDMSCGDDLTLPDGSAHGGADCPAGTVLAGGQTLAWHSSGHDQGAGGDGLPYSHDAAGGGWQTCF